MAINVSLPVGEVTGITTTLVSGGSLSASTTYYYVMFAYNINDYSPYVSAVPYHSPISEEGNFTTTTTGKSVTFNWSNVDGATRYQILLTTVSGDYTNSGGYTSGSETVSDITDGVAGYTVTEESSEVYLQHSYQLVNSFVGDIDRSLGILKIHLDGTDTIDLDDVYDAIVASGYSGYCSYDGYTFILKGNFETDIGDTDSGTLAVTQKNIIFLKGGIIARSPYYVFRFGIWTDDNSGANYFYGCNIDIQNSRYPFLASSDDVFQIYGCRITSCHSIKTDYDENLTTSYYNGGSQTYLNSRINEVKDNILGMSIRGVTSDIYDSKISAGNNWGNGKHVRLDITSSPNMPYKAGGEFYDCSWKELDLIRGYQFSDMREYYTNFYDCSFPAYPNERVEYPYVQYGGLLEVNNYLSNFYYDFYYSLKFTVIDVNGSPISGVTVSGVTASGDSVVWIEHDGTDDRFVTGSGYTGSTLTNASGVTDYYVMAYKHNQNPDHDDEASSNIDTIKTEYFPFTITFSKEGYGDYTIILEDLNERTAGVVTLKAPVLYSKFFDGTVLYAGTQIY